MTAGRGREDESPCRCPIGGDSTRVLWRIESFFFFLFLPVVFPFIEVKSIVKELRDMSAALLGPHMAILLYAVLNWKPTVISGAQSHEPGLVIESIMPNA